MGTMDVPHPLFPRGSIGQAVCQPTAQQYGDHGGRPPPLQAQRSPFRQDQLPQNPYTASTPRMGPSRHQFEDPGRTGPVQDDGMDDEDDMSLGGIIVSPQNADRRRQALAQRISPFDIARLGNVHYHGGRNGYQPLTAQIIHRCGYMEINSLDVLLSYNDIIEVHSGTCDNWEHPCGHYKGP